MSVAAEKIAVLRGTLARVGLEGEPGQVRVALGHPKADSCLLGGILKGALHEVFPAAGGDEASASGFAVAFAARAAEPKRVLWLRPDFSALEHGEISAPGLLELGLDPGRFLLLRAPDAACVLRAGLDALSCASLGALVLEIRGAPKLLDLAASRRLVLAAAQSGVTAVLLRLDADAEPSAAETRWFIRAGKGNQSNKRFHHGSTENTQEENGRETRKPGAPCPPCLCGATSSRQIFREWGYPRFEAELVRHRHGRLGHWMMEWRCDDGLFAATDSGAVVSAASHRPAAAQGTSRVA
jgi:protein ImuA